MNDYSFASAILLHEAKSYCLRLCFIWRPHFRWGLWFKRKYLVHVSTNQKSLCSSHVNFVPRSFPFPFEIRGGGGGGNSVTVIWVFFEYPRTQIHGVRYPHWVCHRLGRVKSFCSKKHLSSYQAFFQWIKHSLPWYKHNTYLKIDCLIRVRSYNDIQNRIHERQSSLYRHALGANR